MSWSTEMEECRLPPLSLQRLPFVRPREDGTVSYWNLSRLPDGSPLAVARTFAAWFLLYEEANGTAAADGLLSAIEREMPSRYPTVDRHFLNALEHHRSTALRLIGDR